MGKQDVIQGVPATSPGLPLPLGATLIRGGCRFSVFSRHATAVSLLLFDTPESGTPAAEIVLDPGINRFGDIWHAEVKGIKEGQLYLWRVDGLYDPTEGHRFNPNKPLLDPYARAVTGKFSWERADARGYDPESPHQDLSFSERSSLPGAPKCVVLQEGFDWQGDSPLGIPMPDSVIYELHVRGFTRHDSSGVAAPGTFPGLVEKIGYLKELGVTAVELLPVHEFDENELIRTNPLTGEMLRNYWGYSTISFFAPKSGYAAGDSGCGEQVLQFKTMVRALHQAGIEVILDVVFNHTAEGDQTGPTLCFRGLDNRIYYLLEEDKRFYKNYSGCGNTLNCNHPIVRDFILDCLRYWVVEMHVDGFRFDLASILGRDSKGNILENPPLLERIAEDPILRHSKIIAEAWDAAGAYQVGGFPGRWAEWNGRYRDDVRRFLRSEAYGRKALATRITGSSDLYQAEGRLPCHSINFVTCHDGFTLNDLVSYNRKHNEANGEENRDGDNNNLSWNFGVEGPSENPEVERLRLRQIKSFLATLLFSQGVPMLVAGDEIRRTQGGNNNAYCQDNEISWIDWRLLEKNQDLFEFARSLVAFRRKHAAFRRASFLTGTNHGADPRADIEWFDANGKTPRWNDNRPTLACYLSGSSAEIGYPADDYDFYLMFNSGRGAHGFLLPSPPQPKLWRLVCDTALEGPGSFRGPGIKRPPLDDQGRYRVEGHAVVLLQAG